MTAANDPTIPATAPDTVRVAVLICGPGQDRLLLPAIRALLAAGHVAEVAAAPGAPAEALTAAGLPFHTGNQYLEPFILAAGRKCLLYAALPPETIPEVGPENPFLSAVRALCAKYGIPAVAAAGTPEATLARVLQAARANDPGIGTPVRAGKSPEDPPRTHAGDGRPLFADLGYERYVRLMGIARAVGAGFGGSYTLLDVGGEDEALQRFVPGAVYAAFDGLIGRDRGTDLPSASYDAVVAADVLEHVPPADRRAFLAELVRVARRRVVFSFPCAAADPHEQFLLQVMPRHRWLREHQDHGLPRTQDIDRWLSELGLSFTRTPNHGLQGWVHAVLFDNLHLDENLRAAVNLFLQEHAFPLEDRDPAYRHIYSVTL